MKFNADRLLLRGDQCERAGFLHKLRNTFDPLFCFSARHEVTKAANDLPGTHCLLSSLVHDVYDRRKALVSAMLEKPSRSLQVVSNCRKRLVEFVGKSRCHFAHGAEPREVE